MLNAVLLDQFKGYFILSLYFDHNVAQVESVHAIVVDDEKDRHVNEKLGLSTYESSPWEVVDGMIGIQRRHLSYRLNRLITQFGSKISSIQQKTLSTDSKKLIINEILTLHDVPFGEHFQVRPPWLQFHASFSQTVVWPSMHHFTVIMSNKFSLLYVDFGFLTL